MLHSRISRLTYCNSLSLQDVLLRAAYSQNQFADTKLRNKKLCAADNLFSHVIIPPHRRLIFIKVCCSLLAALAQFKKPEYQIPYPAAILFITFTHKDLYNAKAFFPHSIAIRITGKPAPTNIFALWTTC